MRWWIRNQCRSASNVVMWSWRCETCGGNDGLQSVQFAASRRHSDAPTRDDNISRVQYEQEWPQCRPMWYAKPNVGCCWLLATRVYCDKRAEARIMQFSLKCSPIPHLLDCQVWLRNSTESPWLEAQTGMGWFSIEFAALYLGNDARWCLGDN